MDPAPPVIGYGGIFLRIKKRRKILRLFLLISCLEFKLYLMTLVVLVVPSV